MKISELSAALQKVQQLAGDCEVVLKDAASEAETVISDLTIHLDPTSGSTGGTLTVEHGAARQQPPYAPGNGAESAATAESASA